MNTALTGALNNGQNTGVKMTDYNPELFGSLSRYAKWAGITLNCAKQRKFKGKVVYSTKYPRLVDFVATQKNIRPMGRPKKRLWEKCIKVTWWLTPAEFADLNTRRLEYRRLRGKDKTKNDNPTSDKKSQKSGVVKKTKQKPLEKTL